ncbi:hypothetical protein HPHPH11_0627 [Helicobacter pylori Hp H-11]|nr:hypothetical protein HPHPH11_0627 [Helicobacter pylori Hp H-11]
MFQPLLDAFIESASIEKMASKSPPPPPKNRCGELVGRR